MCCFKLVNDHLEANVLACRLWLEIKMLWFNIYQLAITHRLETLWGSFDWQTHYASRVFETTAIHSLQGPCSLEINVVNSTLRMLYDENEKASWFNVLCIKNLYLQVNAHALQPLWRLGCDVWIGKRQLNQSVFERRCQDMKHVSCKIINCSSYSSCIKVTPFYCDFVLIIAVTVYLHGTWTKGAYPLAKHVA